MKNNIIKYSLIFMLTTLIMLVVFLEMDFRIESYIIIFFIVSILISLPFVLYKYNHIDLGIIPAIIFISFIFTYLSGVIIIMSETDSAYLKITSIPKEKLIEFYKTRDIEIIPNEYRRTWIGVFCREINIVPRNRIQKIKAVGWKNSSVFAYYDIEEDDYSGSYH